MPFVSVDVQAMPVMRTEGSSTLISQSENLIRLDTEEWLIFSNEGDPYWHFPKGIHVERFDSLLQVDGYLVADTAYFFEKKELWQAIGNVVVKNAEGTVFETSELFWDSRVPQNNLDAFYTHKPVKVVEPNGYVVNGKNGFTADQSLIHIRFYDGDGDIYVVESDETSQQNELVPDSIRLP